MCGILHAETRPVAWAYAFDMYLCQVCRAGRTDAELRTTAQVFALRQAAQRPDQARAYHRA